MQNEPQFTLSPFSPEDGKVIVEKLQKFLAENSCDLVVTPVITKEGTIGAKVEVFRKVELVPKGEPSNYRVEDGKVIDTTENGSDAPEGGSKPVEATKKP